MLSLSTIVTIIIMLIIAISVLSIIEMVILSEDLKLLEIEYFILGKAHSDYIKFRRDLFEEKGGKLYDDI